MHKTAEKLNITIGKSIKLANKIRGISSKSAINLTNFLSKKLATNTYINPYLLLTENRRDIDYQISFLKDVVVKKIDPKKTAYYSFLLEFYRAHNPDLICKEFLNLYHDIKINGIREPLSIVYYPSNFIKASYYYNSHRHWRTYRNERKFQIFDGAKRLAISIFENYKEVSCKIFKPIKFEIPDYTSFINENEILLQSIRKNSRLLQLHKLLNIDFHKYSKKVDSIGRGNFYQGLKSISIVGQRPTEERFKAYGLKKYLKKNFRVLDIGSNCGFFSLYVSQFVGSVDGIEKDLYMVEVANKAKKYLKAKNCTFYRSAFEEFRPNKKYDCIMSFAVHRRVGYSLEEYLNILDKITNKNGFLIIESHDINKEDANFGKDVESTLGKRYAIKKEGNIKDDGIVERRFIVLRKK